MGIYVICVTAIATVVIAWYAIANHKLASKIQSRDDDFRQQVSDLYNAIVISTLVAAHGARGIYGTMEGRIGIFKEHYKGKTIIFD